MNNPASGIIYLCYYLAAVLVGSAWYLLLSIKPPLQLITGAMLLILVMAGYGLMEIGDRLRDSPDN